MYSLRKIIFFVKTPYLPSEHRSHGVVGVLKPRRAVISGLLSQERPQPCKAARLCKYSKAIFGKDFCF
jgi:hypothetical protein